MSTIFRLGTEGSQNHTDWQDSNIYPYNQTNRLTINDPDGASARNEITSIPSPFARIALVKDAFASVVYSKNLDGKTIFHKTVSDALDIGEIFFNIEKLSDQVEIIVWDARKEIDLLKQSTSDGHRYLGDALDKYMQSDATTYNFGQLHNIYLLNYINGQEQLNIIGATSPATLFFSTANDLSEVAKTISFGQDKPFDSEYQPLYKRDFEYVKAWFALRSNIQNFARLFPELNNYLDKTYEAITDHDKKAQLRDIAQYTQNLQPLSIDGTNLVEVLGYPLYKKQTKLQLGDSQFEIRSSRYSEKLPLVLPVEAGMMYSQLRYTTDQWGKENKAPYTDPESNLSQRRLPNDGMFHPYLTIGDLLEDTIIRVEHGLNDEAFFDGNFRSEKNPLTTYLLPLKRRFFEFFTAKELMKDINEQVRMLEMSEVGDGVKVTLRIPIVGNERVHYVEYSRLYYGGGNAACPERNEGAIKDVNFTGFIMPNVRFANPSEAIYRIGCITTYSRNYTLAFYDGTQQISSEIDCRNTEYADSLKSTTYSVEGSNFEYIQFSDRDNHSGVLLPKFRKQQTSKEYHFAVDLGTSNTHIEYVSKGESETSTIVFDKDELLTRFFIPKKKIGDKVFNDMAREEGPMEYDYVPLSLGGKGDFHFPIKTVLSYAKGTDWSMRTRPMGLVNIPFTYYSRTKMTYNEVSEDVKWGEDNHLVSSYIENLSLLIRTLVVVKGGNLSSTKLTWLYPISMAPHRVNAMSETWDKVARKYFGSKEETIRMTESVAPIRYFFDNFATASSLVNIDIGGGTTDIAFARNRQLEFVTSFKFAANDLFESSLVHNPNNGIIDAYKEDFEKLLNGVDELSGILKKLSKPSSIASFLFSLSSNKQTKDLDSTKKDFSLLLRQNEKGFKVVFVLFYTSIIYHIAQILNLKGLSMPRHISFSGNGSKVLGIITSNVGELTCFTQTIFRLLNVKGSDGKIEITGLGYDDVPKQITCKGALRPSDETEDDSNKVVKLCADGKSFVKSDDVYANIDDEYIAKAKNASKEFFDFVLDTLNKEFNFDDYFGVSQETISLTKEVCYDDIDTYIRRGIDIRRKEAGERDNIDETLFFYPLKGVLNVLSDKIANEYNTKKQ